MRSAVLGSVVGGMGRSKRTEGREPSCVSDIRHTPCRAADTEFVDLRCANPTSMSRRIRSVKYP